jgi:hypothetical protein
MSVSQSNIIGSMRPFIDLETSLLLNIRGNLQVITNSQIIGIGLSEIDIQVMKASWKSEIDAINHELIRRN